MEDTNGLIAPSPSPRAPRATAGRVAFWLAVLLAGWALAILLAEPVYDLLTSLGWSRERGYAKVLRRLLLVPPLVVFFLALRPWRDGGLASYGLVGPRARLRPALLAAAATLAAAALLLAFHFAEGWLHWQAEVRSSEVLRRGVRGLAGAFVGAVLEEWLFRGWLHRKLGPRARPFTRALAVALLFAALHAFKPAAIDIAPGAGFSGTLEAIGAWFARLVDPAAFGPSFTGLFLLSLLLTAAYLRTGTLWTAIGIHATGAWFTHAYGAVTERTVERTWAGTKWLTDGPPAWVLMAVAAWALWPRRAPSDVPSGR